jgi:hypothetical protein
MKEGHFVVSLSCLLLVAAVGLAGAAAFAAAEPADYPADRCVFLTFRQVSLCPNTTPLWCA